MQIDELKRQLESKTQKLKRENYELKLETETLKKQIDEFDRNANGVVTENRNLKDEMVEGQRGLSAHTSQISRLAESLLSKSGLGAQIDQLLGSMA